MMCYFFKIVFVVVVLVFVGVFFLDVYVQDNMKINVFVDDVMKVMCLKLFQVWFVNFGDIDDMLLFKIFDVFFVDGIDFVCFLVDDRYVDRVLFVSDEFKQYFYVYFIGCMMMKQYQQINDFLVIFYLNLFDMFLGLVS